MATLLGEHVELGAVGETVQSALERWAFDLWGLDDGQADVDDDCVRTREWFLAAGHELASEDGPRELLSRAAESPTVRRARSRRLPKSDRTEDSK